MLSTVSSNGFAAGCFCASTTCGRKIDNTHSAAVRRIDFFVFIFFGGYSAGSDGGVRLWIEREIFKLRMPAFAALEPALETLACFSARGRLFPGRTIAKQNTLKRR